MKTRLVVVGAAGRMGRRIVALALESGDFDIVGAVDVAGHPDIGKDAGVLAGVGQIGVDVAEVFPQAQADALIDFSLPEAAGRTVDHCLKNGLPLISGTTGLTPKQRDVMQKASAKIPLIYGTNMSVGMNVLFALVGKAAEMLGEQYDIEIIEQHHRFKKDAPSGSALTLAENICKATGRDPDKSLVYGRSRENAERKEGTIGIHAVRAGDITGVHSVMYGTQGETVTLGHTANNRDTFVRGALRAAKWLAAKEPGLYTMADVLGIE